MVLCSVDSSNAKKNIDITVGDATVDAFDLNLDVNNNALHTIASIVCLDLPFCKDAIQNAIDSAIQRVIVENVPDALAQAIAPALQGVVDVAACPGSTVESVVV